MKLRRQLIPQKISFDAQKILPNAELTSRGGDIPSQIHFDRNSINMMMIYLTEPVPSILINRVQVHCMLFGHIIFRVFFPVARSRRAHLEICS